MKILRVVMSAGLAAVLAVSACGEKEQKIVDADKLLKRWGLNYEVNSKTPFTGKAVGYWSSGEKKAEVEFLYGMPNGKTNSWHKNGQKALEAEWRDGKPYGKQTAWYDNGQKMGETKYLNGIEHGKFIRWYRNGQKMVETEYRDGREIKTECWDRSGNPINCDTLRNLF